MNATSHPQDTAPATARPSLHASPDSTPPAPDGKPDAIGAALGDGPLAMPFRKLAWGLDALVASGDLLGVGLDLTHADCPCFLLGVSPDGPKYYVEVFLDSLDDPEGKGETLLVLMNWMGSDTEPAAWEMGLGAANAGCQANASDEENVLDFSEVLGHVLWATGSPAQS